MNVGSVSSFIFTNSPRKSGTAKISISRTLSRLCSVWFCVVENWKGEERADAERRLAGMGYGLWAMAYGPLELNSRGLEAYDRSRSIAFFFVRFPFFQSRKKLGVGVSRFVLTDLKACFG